MKTNEEGIILSSEETGLPTAICILRNDGGIPRIKVSKIAGHTSDMWNDENCFYVTISDNPTIIEKFKGFK